MTNGNQLLKIDKKLIEIIRPVQNQYNRPTVLLKIKYENMLIKPTGNQIVNLIQIMGNLSNNIIIRHTVLTPGFFYF